MSGTGSPHPKSRPLSASGRSRRLGGAAAAHSATSYSTSLRDYQLHQVIGVMDDISHVYLATHLPTQELIALKMTDLQMSTDFELLQEMRDITVNTKLCRHEHIVNFHTSFIDDENLWTVAELVRGGSVRQILHEHYPEGFSSENIIATILRDVLEAVDYLHGCSYIHNNLRADNVLLDYTGAVKLSGLHQMIQRQASGKYKRTVFKFVGDPEWMAPEVLSQATTFNEKVDIYSIGILATELMYGRTPFDGWPALKILLCKLHYECPPVASNKVPSKPFRRFVERCLSKSPSSRPSAAELLDDPFIKLARNPQYLVSHLVRLKLQTGQQDAHPDTMIELGHADDREQIARPEQWEDALPTSQTV